MARQITTGTFAGLGGTRLYYERWLPGSTPGAALVFVHGGNSHCSMPAIQRLGEVAIDANLAFYAYDGRGFGRSQGRNMHIDSFRQPRGDLTALLHLIRLQLPGTKLFISGCSYGALTVVDQAIVNPHLLSGVVAISISTRPMAPGMARLVKIMGSLGRLAPRFGTPAGLAEAFPGAQDQLPKHLAADPLSPASQTLGFIRQALVLRARQLPADLAYLRIPLLHQAGSLDDITPPEPGFGARTASADATFRLYEGCGHDLLNSPQAAAVMTDAVAWVNERSAA